MNANPKRKDNYKCVLETIHLLSSIQGCADAVQQPVLELQSNSLYVNLHSG